MNYTYFFKRLNILLLFWITQSTVNAQFKFGLGLLGYTKVLSPLYNQDLSSNAWSGYLEFAGLIKDHFEPGIQIGGYAFIHATEDFNNPIPFKNTSSATILGYLRYYFLENLNIRPYVFGGLGYANHSVKITQIKTITLPFLGTSQYKQSIVTETQNAFAYKIGAGVRLWKYMDLGLHYTYLGSIENTLENKVYQAHGVEFSLALTFGGNLKNTETTEKPARPKKESINKEKPLDNNYGKGQYY
jgi:opacity protein-like surface antigen